MISPSTTGRCLPVRSPRSPAARPLRAMSRSTSSTRRGGSTLLDSSGNNRNGTIVLGTGGSTTTTATDAQTADRFWKLTRVDITAPVVNLTCPADPVVLGSSAPPRGARATRSTVRALPLPLKARSSSTRRVSARRQPRCQPVRQPTSPATPRQK